MQKEVKGMYTGEIGGMTLKMAKTLWFNTYRGIFSDALGEYVAAVRIIPAIPLDRQEVPEDAPEARPYLTVIVEDATISLDQLVEFETAATDVLLNALAKEPFKPEFVQFFYPNPSIESDEPEENALLS